MADFYLFRFKTLQTRLTVLLLIPVFVLMFTAGVVSFFYTRNAMLTQWNESSALKLQRAAHGIEMRILAPIRMLDLLFKSNVQTTLSSGQIIGLLGAMDGVTRVDYAPKEKAQVNTRMGKKYPGMAKKGQGRMLFHRSRISSVSEPNYDTAQGQEIVTVTLVLSDAAQKTKATLEIHMGVDYLLEDITRLGWWQSDLACIVTGGGKYVAHTNMIMTDRVFLGDKGDPLELAILEKIKTTSYGTVQSKESSPEKIAGFYTLDQVPWTVILFAKGDILLAPIINYRNAFALGSLCLVVLILILIRFQTGQVVNAIQLISNKARKVAKGDYGSPIPVTGQDEISQLVKSYNAMVKGLEERDLIRNSFGRYVDPEFAKTLLARPDAGKLGGDRREVVILMSDIRGFTQLSESLSPEIIIQVLNQYFSRMIQIIQAHDGIIVDFIGDAILVFFDPPQTPISDTVRKAIDCAGSMQTQMDAFNIEMEDQGMPALYMGIGLNAGQVVVGNIGSHTRAKYGIVGSAVNITSRIQARAQAGEIVVPSVVIPCLRQNWVAKRSFSATLKGIKDPMDLSVIDHIS